MPRPAFFAMLSLLAVAACGDAEETDPPGRDVPPQTCFAPVELGGSPQSIEDVVALINALPKPLDLPCLLQTLDRPLELNATSNVVSAQPAYGPNNPRIFIVKNNLVLSVVPKGDGRPLLEMSVMRSPNTSVKAEIEFPVTDTLPPSAPYDRVVFEGGSVPGTTCGFCHLGEGRDPLIDFADAFESQIIELDFATMVELDYLKWAYSECDRDLEPDRCAMFDAIFGYGEVTYRYKFAEP